MAIITFEHQGNFENTNRFLTKMRREEIFDALNVFGTMGVNALASVTPVDTGYTASSWNFEIEKTGRSYSIIWTNQHIIPGHAPLIIMLQYGHGTGTGGSVQGRDFINPAIQPIFDAIANSVWREVQNA